MRAIVAAWLVVVTACEEHGSRGPDGPPLPPDAAPSQCLPTGNCADGPMCNGVCCADGEHCEAGGCRCGSFAACAGGDRCVQGGLIGPVLSGCGSLCCGGPSQCPI